MESISFILSSFLSVTHPSQQWVKIESTETEVKQIWIEPRYDKGPQYFKFIYRTIQQPVTSFSSFHDFLGWVNCDTQQSLIEISGYTSEGNTFYLEKTDNTPFLLEPKSSQIISIICP